jgi:radical SAM-linked protein
MISKIRVSYSKVGKVRFTGHRDVAHMWERSLRKAEMPVAMSGGFHPRPKLAFGLALPTGAESVIELIDITLDAQSDTVLDDLNAMRERLSLALPVGLAVTDIWIPDQELISLQEGVVASSWLMMVDAPDIETEIDRINASSVAMLERERKGERHVDDVRPAILELQLAEPSLIDTFEPQWSVDRTATPVEAVLSNVGRSIRPTELIEVLLPARDPWDHLRRVLRTKQWIERDGQRIDVLADRAACPIGSA